MKSGMPRFLTRQAGGDEMPADRLNNMAKDVRMRMYAAGADYVIDTIDELPALIECINKRME